MNPFDEDLETLETVGNFGGNTRTPKSRMIPAKKWCFTAYEDEMETLEMKILKIPEIKYGFGRELCPTTKKEHSQGFVETKEKIRPVEFFKTKTVHWEKMKGSINQNIKYCSKDGKYTTNTELTIEKTISDPMEGLALFGWQIEIKNIINEKPDNRKIYVYIDSKGGIGKSTFAKHLVIKHGAISVSGKSADVKCAISEMIKNKHEIHTVIWDLPRCVGDMINYQSIEEVKNGMFFSGKYESGMVLFEIPHIIIFTNSVPELDKLSADRWVIRNLSEADGICANLSEAYVASEDPDNPENYC